MDILFLVGGQTKMPCMGPNIDAYRKEAELVLSLMDESWLKPPFGFLPFQVGNSLAHRLYLIEPRQLTEWIVAFAYARPEGSFETFRAYLIEMFILEYCWDDNGNEYSWEEGTPP